MRVEDGGARFCLYLLRSDGKPFLLTDSQRDALGEIDGAEEVASDWAQPYRVVFHLERIEELTPARVERARREIAAVLGRELRGEL